MTAVRAVGELLSMPRQLRVEYPGAIYHVMSRGDLKKDIYLDDVDRHDFLKTLAKACQKTGKGSPIRALINRKNVVRSGFFSSVAGVRSWIGSPSWALGVSPAQRQVHVVRQKAISYQ